MQRDSRHHQLDSILGTLDEVLRKLVWDGDCREGQCTIRQRDTIHPIQSKMATLGGMVAVLSGSIIPKVGLSLRLAMPVLDLVAVSSKIATPVVSLPVPAVVGIAIRGGTFPGGGIPFPRGGLT